MRCAARRFQRKGKKKDPIPMIGLDIPPQEEMKRIQRRRYVRADAVIQLFTWFRGNMLRHHNSDSAGADIRGNRLESGFIPPQEEMKRIQRRRYVRADAVLDVSVKMEAKKTPGSAEICSGITTAIPPALILEETVWKAVFFASILTDTSNTASARTYRRL
jgi:hypothetical protein